MKIKPHPRLWKPLTVTLSACAMATATQAAVVLYDGGPFAGSSPGGFSFGGLGGAGLVEGPDTLTLDGSAFGGVGRDLSVPANVDPVGEQVRIVYRILDNNVASDFRIILRDNDGDDSAPGLGTEDHQLFVDMSFASPLGDGSGFSEQFIPIAPVFRAKSFGFTHDGDGVLNPGLDQWQIQSAFSSTDRLNIEVATLEIVPEPATAALIGLGLGLLTARRRNATPI